MKLMNLHSFTPTSGASSPFLLANKKIIDMSEIKGKTINVKYYTALLKNKRKTQLSVSGHGPDG